MAESWRAQELCSEVLTRNLPHIRQYVDPLQVIYGIKDFTDAQREMIATACESKSKHDGAVKLYNVLKTCHSGTFCQFIEMLNSSPGSSVLACEIALDFINTLNNAGLTHRAQNVMSSFTQKLQSDLKHHQNPKADSVTVAVQCTDGTNNQTAGSTLNSTSAAAQYQSQTNPAQADNQTTERQQPSQNTFQPAEVTVYLRSNPGAEYSPGSMESNIDNRVIPTDDINTQPSRNRTDDDKVLNTDDYNPNMD